MLIKGIESNIPLIDCLHFLYHNIVSNSQELKTHSLVQNNYSGSRFRNNFNIQIILCWRPRIYQIKQGPSKDKAVLILKHNAPKKKKHLPFTY